MIGSPSWSERELPEAGSLLQIRRKINREADHEYSGTTVPLMAAAPWMSVFPGLAIATTVLGLNLLGDGLRDCLDPRIQVH